MTADLRAEAADWLARRQRDALSPDEAQAFAEWLARSDAHRHAWTEAEALWHTLRRLDTVAAPQLAEARRQFRRRAARAPHRHRLVARAAGAALLLVGALLIGHAGTDAPQLLGTAVGERRSVTLDDGSVIDLDSGTRAEVRYRWWSREVRLLDGQALFTVAHARWPRFTVDAGPARVIDIGTRFEVRRRGDVTAVAVLDGRVDVRPAPGAAETRLTAGLAVEVAADGGLSVPRSVALDSIAAWRRDELIVRDQPLAAVLADLARYQPAVIATAAPELLPVRISGVFPTDDLPRALTTLAAVLPARLVPDGERRWRLEQR